MNETQQRALTGTAGGAAVEAILGAIGGNQELAPSPVLAPDWLAVRSMWTLVIVDILDLASPRIGAFRAGAAAFDWTLKGFKGGCRSRRYPLPSRKDHRGR
jgi:hypothetical protein